MNDEISVIQQQKDLAVYEKTGKFEVLPFWCGAFYGRFGYSTGHRRVVPLVFAAFA
jgi:hypothetical protein